MFSDRLERARQGSASEVGRLLCLYTNYLKVLARAQLDRRITHRVSPSDLVQDTLLEAHRDFLSFRGSTDGEFIGWLRQILVHNLMRVSRQHLGTEKRDVRREISLQSLGEALEGSRAEFDVPGVGEIRSPSSALDKQERSRLLADAMATLPDDQLQIIVMRHIQGLPFNEIAELMQRSSGACRMLWLRAMEQLRHQMLEQSDV